MFFQVFPDITICNVYQLNSLYTNSITWSKYMTATRNRYLRWPLKKIQSEIPSVTAESYYAVWNSLLSKDGYYNSLPLDVNQTQNNPETVGNPTVIWCFTSEWNSVRANSCMQSVRVRWNPMYYRCSTIEFSSQSQSVRTSFCITRVLDDSSSQSTHANGIAPEWLQPQGLGLRRWPRSHFLERDSCF